MKSCESEGSGSKHLRGRDAEKFNMVSQAQQDVKSKSS